MGLFGKKDNIATIDSKKVGLRDIPIEKMEEEKLGLSKYADALTNFALKCETPMTIALQGDWGSGKTSLMNVIKENLKEAKPNGKNIQTIWFNTWQFSQFDLGNNLPLLLIEHFVTHLDDSKNKTKSFNMMKVLKFSVVATATVLGAGDTMNKCVESLEKSNGSEIPSPVKAISDLKKQIKIIIDEKMKNDNLDRIVVFIDDLDRLNPAKAIELLENFKLFLDIESCVFFLAVDYNVVVQGLKSKFGLDEGEMKGKSFFDKIIQVPFNMPIDKYEVGEYFKTHLTNIGMDFREEDIKLYGDLVNSSIRFNPRSMKRLFNSLILLKLVGDKDGVFDSDKKAKSYEKIRIMFSILCMQLKFPTLYSFLKNQSINSELYNKFINKDDWINSDEVSQLREDIKTEEEAKVKFKIEPQQIDKKVQVRMNEMGNFMEYFYKAIQLESVANDKELLEDEIENLKNIMKLSAVVATETNENKAERSRYLSKDEFLKKLTGKPLKYYNELFDYIEDEDIEYEMKSVGFHINNKKGKVIQCNPPGGKRSSIFIDNIQPKKKKEFKKHMEDKDMELDTSGAGNYLFTYEDLPIKDLCEIIKIIT